MSSLNTDEILKKYKLTLIDNHTIYFKELEDTAYGVLAEDTNYMIQNIGKHSKITVEVIEKNLKLLKTIIFENKEPPCSHSKSHRDMEGSLRCSYCEYLLEYSEFEKPLEF